MITYYLLWENLRECFVINRGSARKVLPHERGNRLESVDEFDFVLLISSKWPDILI